MKRVIILTTIALLLLAGSVCAQRIVRDASTIAINDSMSTVIDLSDLFLSERGRFYTGQLPAYMSGVVADSSIVGGYVKIYCAAHPDSTFYEVNYIDEPVVVKVIPKAINYIRVQPAYILFPYIKFKSVNSAGATQTQTAARNIGVVISALR